MTTTITTTKPGCLHPSTTWFTEYIRTIVETYCLENDTFTMLLLTDNVPGDPRMLIEMSRGINIVFMPANITAILQPKVQGIILTFNSYCLKNTFHRL